MHITRTAMNVFAKLILLAITPAAAQQSSSALVGGYLTGTDGSTIGTVAVDRFYDPTSKLFGTMLFYRLCTGTSCQEGSGRIPSSTLVGNVYTELNRPDTLSLLVDTSAISGNSGCGDEVSTPCFSNWTCLDADQWGNCNGGTVPATGGIISLSWARTSASAFIETYSDKAYQFGKLTSSSNQSVYAFSANQTGTVLGASALNIGQAFMDTASSDSKALRGKFLALKGRTQ